ncbi:hypothetical protein [Helicobacter turcicus]|uniref:Uncharacterized protein n=1 Tax=Helicobacter turcicus TaxID=2867412 RepID=A0ABS7JP45_9HELI|nr:hypothetical protein [Helicobacter turcicus]MBX7491158.1 hypothetical protein [Helicobacter turcicus]MBX7546025.1 hypothetical protein [Helicobacter turcicus]
MAYKIAIQFYGHLRSYKDTFAFFQKNVLAANAPFGTQIDVFMHTWNELEHTALRAQYKKDFAFAGKKVSKEDLDFVKENYKPKAFLCTPQVNLSPKEKEFVEQKGFKAENYIAIFNVSYAMAQVDGLRKAYSKKHKIKYDLIVLVRPDILFKEPLVFHKALNDRTLGKHKFLHFGIEEFNKCVFYAYMQKEPLHDELFRNQKLYVTGIDLLCMASEWAMSHLCSWHSRVLNFAPMGIEWWLTKQIVDNGLEISLMYYQKPANFTILRTNDSALKEQVQSAGGGGIYVA